VPVLGEPVRWSVVNELRHGTRCACELAESSGAAPSLLSHHLGVLRDAGLVTAVRRGRWIDYTLVTGRLDDFAGALLDGDDSDAGASGATAPAEARVA
jgi:ArsR family transcriptional regulator